MTSPTDGKFGEEVSPGVYNGMIGMVNRSEVMVGVAAFNINDNRSEVVKFATPMDIIGYTYMYERPKELSRALLFVRPFRKTVTIHLQYNEDFYVSLNFWSNLS